MGRKYQRLDGPAGRDLAKALHSRHNNPLQAASSVRSAIRRVGQRRVFDDVRHSLGDGVVGELQELLQRFPAGARV